VQSRVGRSSRCNRGSRDAPTSDGTDETPTRVLEEWFGFHGWLERPRPNTHSKPDERLDVIVPTDRDLVSTCFQELKMQIGHDVVIERTPGDDIGIRSTNKSDLDRDQLLIIPSSLDLGNEHELVVDFAGFDFQDKGQANVLHAGEARHVPDLWIPATNIEKSVRSPFNRVCNERTNYPHAVIVARWHRSHQAGDPAGRRSILMVSPPLACKRQTRV